MKEKALAFIQDQIRYQFKNKDLLKQAFVRRSYSEENGGENNEVLEFIGDKALDFSVVRYFARKYGHMMNGAAVDPPKLSARVINLNPAQENSGINSEFICDHDEGVLSELKKKLVNKKTLACRVDELGLADFLVMGKGDTQNSIAGEASVKEDLFEAILGAVVLDCAWDMDRIFKTAEIMLAPEQFLTGENSDNYVELIQEWSLWKNSTAPLYHFEQSSYEAIRCFPFKGESQRFNLDDSREAYQVQYYCLMKIDDNLPVFRGFGRSKAEARSAVCKLAYEYLGKHDLLLSIKDEIENPNKADAINQLEILARRGYFSIPTYDFKQSYDQDGDSVWKCTCHIAEYDTFFEALSSSKKAAKKTAAFEMLKYVLGEEE